MARSMSLQQTARKAAQRRQRSPRPQANILKKVSFARRERITRDNLDVLFAIESTLLNCASDDDRVDDRVAWLTLRHLLLDEPPTSMPHAWIYSELLVARKGLESEPSDELWTDCLRCVYDSIAMRSTLREGDCSYLTFIDTVIGSAQQQ